MLLFMVMMGNTFAAFPVITLEIGIPFIVNAHGGNSVTGVFGMSSGYGDTLLTPMEAIGIFNVVMMDVCVYRF